MKLDASKANHWVWYSALDKRNGYWGWGPVGTPFNRAKPLHWFIAVVDLWRKGKRDG